jgi:1,2-phenylacetyl-CoA epoxidase PaaB subunit
MARDLYEVFARKERSEPLSHVGTVRATSVDFARVYARNTYDEENWVEMTIVPRTSMIPILEIEPLIDPGSAGSDDAGD